MKLVKIFGRPSQVFLATLGQTDFFLNRSQTRHFVVILVTPTQSSGGGSFRYFIHLSIYI